MKVYLRNPKWEHDYSEDVELFEVDKSDIFDVYKFRGEYYSVCMVDFAMNLAVARKVNMSEKGVSREYTSNLTCPYCGYENLDSWEMADSDTESQCGVCGSVFSYDREIEVTYSSHPVEPPEIKLIEE